MWPPRRPLLGLALVQVAALAAGFHFPLPLALAFGVGAGLALAGLLLHRRTSSLPCLYLGWICWCLAAARWTVADPSPVALARQAPPVPVTVELRAVLTDDPVAYAGARADRLQWVFPAEARDLNLAGAWRGVRGPVRVYWRARAGDCQPVCGDRWRFRGELYPPRAPAAPGASWVLRAAAGTREARGAGLRAWAFRGRAWCADTLGLGLAAHPDAAGLLRAMLLGLRQELTPDWREAFATTGTLHVFAISGLHVGVLALLVTLVLKMFGVSRMHWFWWLAPLLILYTLGTGLKTSALRATLMALVYFAGLSLGRRPDSTNSLALAALLILGWAPAQLHDVGFQLSFVVVGGLSAWYGPLRRRLPSGRIRDPLKIGPATKWEHGAHQALRYFWGLVAASLAAWLASWPLVAYHFNLISPSGLVGNLLVVPASFVIVLTGLLALLTGLLFPLLAAVFNTANSVVIAGLLALIEALQRVPGSHVFVVAPPLATLVGWYALLALARGPRWRGRPLALMLALALVGAGPLAAWQGRTVTLDILDVGHGHCALLTPTRGPAVLIDAGPARETERILRQARARGVNRLAVLVLTKPDANFVGGASAWIERGLVQEIWTTPDPGQSPVFTRVLAQARAHGLPVRTLTAGEQGDWPGGLTWEVHHPPPATDDQPAAGPLVLRVGGGAQAVWFMTAVSSAVETELAARPFEAGATVLVLSQHGAVGAAQPTWLERVRPDWVVISVGAGNYDGAPAPAVLDTLADGGWRVWRTDLAGAFTLRWTP